MINELRTMVHWSNWIKTYILADTYNLANMIINKSNDREPTLTLRQPQKQVNRSWNLLMNNLK